ncbi:MAG: sialidase family protein [Planctomycetota bacterium]
MLKPFFLFDVCASAEFARRRGLATLIIGFVVAVNGDTIRGHADEPTPESEPTATTSSDVERVVFRSGEEGYPVYRIPALVRAANGDLLAFCEARQKGDASEIDLVLKRSSDDGETWSALRVVQESDDFRHLFGSDPPPITIGNPAPVVDLMDPDHPGRIWLPFTVENHFVFVAWSDDHGATWAKPRQLTDEVKLESWGWYATGPGHSIQIQSGPHRGRLVIPADHRLGGNGEDRGPNGAQVILSDDHGRRWRLGAIDATYDDGLNANETTVAELGDGTLYFNTRDQHGSAPGTRGGSWSIDGGDTFATRTDEWTAFQPTGSDLTLPVVQASVIRFQGRLLLSGPDEDGPSGKGRSDLRVRVSGDQGLTWQDGPLLHVGPAAYSDMVALNDTHVGILFEAGSPKQKSPYQSIRFERFQPN